MVHLLQLFGRVTLEKKWTGSMSRENAALPGVLENRLH